MKVAEQLYVDALEACVALLREVYEDSPSERVWGALRDAESLLPEKVAAGVRS